MKQQKTRDLHSYWSSRKAGTAVPKRRSLDPKDISRLLPDVFVIESTGEPWRFRLAGSGICDRHCMEMKGVPFREVWDVMDQRHVDAALDLVARDGHCCVMTSVATVRDYAIEFETLFLPIAEESGAVERIIGIQNPETRPWPLGSQPITPHSLVSVGIVGSDEVDVFAPRDLRVSPAPIGCRAVRHLRVIEGGLGS